jgi:hypothetical protein
MSRERMVVLGICLTALLFHPGCRTTTKGLSIEEVLNANIQVPVYYLDTSADATPAEFDTTYYYFDDSSEIYLYAYFTTKDVEGQTIRVARLMTCSLCGQLVNIDETKGELPAPITWSKGGGACTVTSEADRIDQFEGERYQSCLYWMDEDLYAYKLYTVWSEEEAVEFANSLVRK